MSVEAHNRADTRSALVIVLPSSHARARDAVFMLARRSVFARKIPCTTNER